VLNLYADGSISKHGGFIGIRLEFPAPVGAVELCLPAPTGWSIEDTEGFAVLHGLQLLELLVRLLPKMEPALLTVHTDSQAVLRAVLDEKQPDRRLTQIGKEIRGRLKSLKTMTTISAWRVARIARGTNRADRVVRAGVKEMKGLLHWKPLKSPTKKPSGRSSSKS